MENCNVILVTGPPGAGKTTLILKICNEIKKNYSCSGFVTEEVRKPGFSARIGFDVVTLNGDRTPLARECAADSYAMPKIGKYSVYVKDFEDLVLPLLAQPEATKTNLLVIDEIGKMELKSKKFETAVRSLINKVPILATIPYQLSQQLPLVEQLKNSTSARIFKISKNNRDKVQQDITKCIENILKNI